MQEWNEINTEADIENFLSKTRCMHDAVIISLEYLSGCDVNNDRITRIPYDGISSVKLIVGSCWFGKIEMLFSGVKYFCSGRSADMWNAVFIFVEIY